MFWLYKLTGLLLHPLTWVILLLVVGLLIQSLGQRPVAGRGWFVTALLLLIFLGWELPPTMALRTLENRYLARQQLPDDVQGIIVLGGSTDRSTLAGPGRSLPLNEAAERLTEGATLARQHPDWVVIYAGGNGRVWVSDQELSEAKLAEMFFQQQGLSTAGMRFESRSRNTTENARLSGQMSGVDKRARWLLVTSAWHMPRAMEAFEREGWNVLAYPVDFRADPQIRWVHYSFKHGPLLWQTYLHERFGLLASRWFLR